MPHTMGGQGFEGSPEIPVDFVQLQTSLRANRSSCPLLIQPRLGELIQAVMQGVHLAGLHRESTRSRVASEPLQQIRTGC